MGRIMLDKTILGIWGNMAQMECFGQNPFVQVGCVWGLKKQCPSMQLDKTNIAVQPLCPSWTDKTLPPIGGGGFCPSPNGGVLS